MEPLFFAETEYTLKEVKRFSRFVQFKNDRWLLAAILIIFIFFSYYMSGNFFDALISCAIMIVVFFLLNFLINEFRIRGMFKSNKIIQNAVEKYNFYAECLKIEGKSGTANIRYEDFYKILETKTNFYLMIAKNQGYILSKENCSPELISFLRNLKQI